jgi:hypothetical protein
MSKGSFPVMSLTVFPTAVIPAHRAVTLAGAYPAAGAFALGVLALPTALTSSAPPWPPQAPPSPLTWPSWSMPPAA